ncbi:MAG: hypothetical protein NVSMB54_23080 [Ktedonobacteraceae bacterium]
MNRQATYSNPFWSRNFPDPFVFKVRGRYYAYATDSEEKPMQGTLVFPILTSTDLVSWHEVGKAMPALGDPYYLYWAPEVTMYNGQFLLYYAVHNAEEFASSIRVAIADSPEGPFIDSGHDLTCSQTPWAIDPHVFRDQDGQWYLYMTIEYLDSSASFVGSGNAVDRLIDPFTLEGNLTRVTPPSQGWQLYEAQRQSKGGIDWYTVEGPTVLQHRRKYYEMFSGGCYYRDNYAISYATSNVPMGSSGLRDTSWQDWQGRTGHAFLVQGTQHVLSPGHNSLVLGPNNAEQYIVYHTLQSNMLERYACLDRLFWHGDEMWTAAPTYTPQPVPAIPRFRELFDATVLNTTWQEHGGEWNVSQGAAIQSDKTSVSALLAQRQQLNTDWLLEVNLRLLAGNGAYGILFEDTTHSPCRLTIRSDTQHIWLDAQTLGSAQTVSLPTDVALQAWHQLIITVSGSVFTVQFDGIHAMEGVLASALCSFALLTEQCSAAFSGISLTDHFLDEFLSDTYNPALLGWETETDGSKGIIDNAANWHVRDGALHQENSAPGTHILLKGSQYESCECGATMKLNTDDEPNALGLVLWLSEADKRFLWLARDASKNSILSIDGCGALASETLTQKLPETFDLHNWHTLRIRYQRDIMTLFLDGSELLTLALPSNLYTMGLATKNAKASFTGVWQTA